VRISGKRLPGVSGFMLLALVPCMLFGTIRFSVDYATFRSSHPDSVRVEIYHSLPWEQLHYQSFGDTLFAEYKVSLKLKNLATNDSTLQSVFEPAVIPQAAKPAERRLSVAHSFWVNLAPGRYRMWFDISDTVDRGSVTEDLVVRDVRSGLSVSDPIIGNTVLNDEGGAASVLPLASRTFGGRAAREMFVYVEGYDFQSPAGAGETLHHFLTAVIYDSTGAAVKTLPVENRARAAGTIAEVFGVTTQGLTPGRYRLSVSLRDAVTDSSAGSEKWFYVLGAEAPVAAIEPTELTPDETKEYNDIKPIATEPEWKFFQKLNESGKAEYLKKTFWRKHDFQTYLRRLAIADVRFELGRKRGRDTDRGRIYLRYGEPDEVEVHTMIEHARPHEHWRYYNLGFNFIFIDVRNDGNYRLIYSNTDVEPKDPNWKNLVDPLETDELQD
jgi:GWxTD domain-containing protein